MVGGFRCKPSAHYVMSDVIKHSAGVPLFEKANRLELYSPEEMTRTGMYNTKYGGVEALRLA